MRSKKVLFVAGFLPLFIIAALLACAKDKAPLQIENSLPQNELACYNDSFDAMREDLWNEAGYINLEEQMQNFKLADRRFENGKLIILTKTGSFSRGGLYSKYALRGDFDVQLDCRIDFLKGASDMDQLLSILVADKGTDIDRSTKVFIDLNMGAGLSHARISSRAFINGRREWGISKSMEHFNGTLRVLRTGKYISTLYKETETSEWNTMNTFRVNGNDMKFVFVLANYFGNRTSIRATQSIYAEFDNFKINAAHEIIEEEI